MTAPPPIDDLTQVDIQKLKDANNWQSQFRLITQWGGLITHKPFLRVEQNYVKGCETAAWLAHRREGERHFFYFDSDSKIICGLAAIALSLINGKTTAHIQENDLEQRLQEMGINKHLTPSRSNGFRAILAYIKMYLEH